VDDEDVNVSNDVVRVAPADVGVSVDVDSTAIEYNHNVTVYCNAGVKTHYALMRSATALQYRPITSTYCDYRACMSVCLCVHPLAYLKTKSSCSYEIFSSCYI